MTSGPTTNQMMICINSSFPTPAGVYNSIVRPEQVFIEANEIEQIPEIYPFIENLYTAVLGFPTIIFINVSETLDLTDSPSVFAKHFISVSETLDLTDSATGVRKVFISVTESLDLTDSRTVFAKHFINVSDTLDLTDTRTVFAKHFINVNETLDLTDTRTIFAKKFISVAENLDLTDARTVFRKAFIAVSESLDLTDSANVVVTPGGPPPPPQIGPMVGGYKPRKDTVPVLRDIFQPEYIMPKIVNISVQENLDLVDDVNIRKIPRKMRTAVELFFEAKATPLVQEQLDMTDSVEIKVIRKGSQKIFNQLMGIAETLDLIDELSPESAEGIAQDINLGITKTNRLGQALEEKLQRDLKKQLNLILKDYKNSIVINDEVIKEKYKDEIYALIRVAVEESYRLGIQYVGKALKEKSIFLSKKDFANIESETIRINEMLWRSIFEKLRKYRLNRTIGRSPLNYFGDFNV